MRRARLTAALAIVLAALAAVLTAAGLFASEGGAPNVTTAAYGNLRDGWDSHEPGLSPTAVRSASFGELFSTKVTGAIYAQPLAFNGTVIVTTEQANAYGINSATGAIEWSRSFGTPFKSSTIGCSDLTPYIGSTSTPVIDPASATVYLTTRLETGKGLAGAHWYLQALSASTGEEKPGFPVQIAGTPSNTPGVPFDESYEMQRPGLLLLGGVVYMAFASDCDITPYRGIVVGASARSGAIETMWSDESGVGIGEDSQAGIWQSGGGLVSAASRQIILTSGNGVSPTPAPSGAPPPTLSESVMALAVGARHALAPVQFFSPSNAPTLDQNDEDLGSGGPIALPPRYFGTSSHPDLLVQVGKDGRVFLLDAQDMGGFRQGAGNGDAVLQSLGPFDGVWGHPAAYGGQGGWVYELESAGGGFLRALSYGVGGGGEPQLASAATSSESFGYTSGSPLVTSRGTAAGSAVVWVVYSSGPSGSGAQLRAYSAAPSAGTLPLLWSAPIGTASKFSVPTAYNGRMYVGTRDGHLIAFGASANAPVQAAPLEFGSVPVGAGRTLTLSVSAAQPLSITGPVTVGGEEKLGAAATPATPGGATAGPSKIPPSGNAPIAPGTVFTIAAPPAGKALSGGASVAVNVTFTPRNPGPVVALVSIPTSAGVRTVPVTGYGTAPGLLLSSTPLAFGTIDTGAGGKTLSFTFSNPSSRPETLAAVRLPVGPYAVSGLPPAGSVLAPRQAVTVSVHFDPRAAGSYPASLELVSDAGSALVQISGKASTGAAHLSVTPSAVSAGSVPVGASRSVAFEVGNTGNVPLTISRAIAPSEPFTATDPVPEGIIIEPGTFLKQTVVFTPASAGPAGGRYEFNSDTGQGPVYVTFTGSGR